MKTRLTIIWLCNLVDTISTLYLYGLGYVEANPIMNWLLQTPCLFVMVKLLTMSAIVLYLATRPLTKYTITTSWIVSIIYGAIAIYYCTFFIFFNLQYPL